MDATKDTLAQPQVEITWLGHAGFRLATPDVVVLIDPWLSPHELRTSPAPPLSSVGEVVHWLLATHEHDDHLDLPTVSRLVRLCPAMRLVAPTPVLAFTHDVCPPGNSVGMQPGDHHELPGLSIHAVSARHAVTIDEGYSDASDAPEGQARFVGFVIDLGGVRVYHAGDSLVSDAITTELRALRPDVVMLPVNGRDHFREARGIVGNMNAAEAVQLAAAVGSTILIPMHHDAVRGNDASRGEAAEAAADLDLPVHVLNLARLRAVRVAPCRTPITTRPATR